MRARSWFAVVMLGTKRRGWIVVVSVTLFAGCGTPSRHDDAAKVEGEHLVVERASCFRAATERTCKPGLEVSFEGEFPKGGQKAVGTIRCEGGRPHARISMAGKEAVGEVGQVVWEALWRVLEATDDCALAFGAPATVTIDGRARACKEPRSELGPLVTRAYLQARSGPPHESGPTSICEIDPGACGSSTSQCPRFDGDEWNGVRAKADTNGSSSVPE